MPIQNPTDIRLNERDDLEAIIGNPPGWTLRWGMSVLFGVLSLLVFIAWLVRYPDTVEAHTVLTTEHPPIRLMAKVGARLAEFDLSNGQAVEKGEILGVFENPAKREDVAKLKYFLARLSENKPSSYLSTEPPEDLELGALDASNARFGKRFAELKHFLEKDINYLKINNLRKQILDLERLNRSLAKQAVILYDEVAVAYSGLHRDSVLRAQKSVSELELETTKAAWLRKKRELENLKSGRVQNDLRIRQMQAQILDLQQLRSDGESERLLNFQSEIESLRGEIEVWENTYLLSSPIDGKVALTSAWSAHQFVAEGTEVLTVVPISKAGKVIGKTLLTGPRIGKLKPGMTAYLRLEDFPYQEYGVLKGRLESITDVPGKNGYEALVSLTDGMRTSHGREIPFRQEMKATVRIVTEERSYLERILENFWATFERN